MKQAEVKAHIERNLIAAGLPIEDLRVQPDTFLGWLVAVVSPGFIGMVWEKRLAIVLQARTRREMREQRLTPELRFLVSPVPASKESEMQRYRSRTLAWIADWLAPLADRRGAVAPPVDAEQMTHGVPYQKRIATAEGLLGEKGVLRHYQPIADWLEPFLASTSDDQITRK